MIKLFSPYIPKEAAKELEKTLFSGQIAQGPLVDEFEKKFNHLFARKYSVALNSGTAALELAYDLVRLKKGDEVISTPLTCTATHLPLLRRKVKIVWADILEDTLCIDPLDVRAKLTYHTKAVIQVHLGGVQADVGRMHIPVISDACQALGIFTGDFSCCSFQAIKTLTTGDGGMLIVNSESDCKKAKLLRWFGIDRERKIDNSWKSYKTRMMTCEPQLAGYKYQMNDLTATLGLVGLRYYVQNIAYRHKLFILYQEGLKSVAGIKIVGTKNNLHWLMTILVERRDDFARMLFSAGVETNLVHIRNDIYKIFGGMRADLPVLNSVENKYISLPIGMHVKEEDVHYICETLKKGW